MWASCFEATLVSRWLAALGLANQRSLCPAHSVRRCSAGASGARARQPFILFSWLVRRSFYIELAPQWAAWQDSLCLLMVARLYMMLSHFSSHGYRGLLAIMSFASLIAGAWVLLRLKVNPMARPDKTLMSESLEQHMRSGGGPCRRK